MAARVSGMCRLLVLLALFGACNGSNRAAIPQGLSTTTAQGFVVQVNPVFLVPDLASAPAGAVPVAGAELKVFDLQGELLATATADATGAFVIPDLPSGFLSIEARVNPGSVDPDVTAEVTGYPGAVIDVGAAPAISRDQAIQLAQANWDASMFVTGSLQPIRAGTTVQPTDIDPIQDPARARTLASDEWLFYVNVAPDSAYAGLCKYVFVDAATGAVSVIDDASWPPTIGGVMLWAVDRTYIRFTGIDLEATPPDGRPDSATPSPEVVQLPPEPPLTDPVEGIPHLDLPSLAGHNVDPASIFTITWWASPELYRFNDVDRMESLYKRAGIPDANRTLVISHVGGAAGGLPQYLADLAQHNAAIAQRLQSGLHSTLIVYICDHGSGSQFCDAKDRSAEKYNYRSASELQLETTLACRVRVIFDFCFAEGVGRPLAAIFDAIPQKDRFDYAIYCACKDDEFTYSIPTWLSGVTLTVVADGGRFTTNVLKFAQIQNGDITGLQDPTGTKIRDELSSLFGTISPFVPNQFFHPVVFIKPNEPDRCKQAPPPPPPAPITATPTPINFSHTVGVSPCPQNIGSVLLRNTSGTNIGWSFSPDNPAIEAVPPGGTLPIGGTTTVGLRFNCAQATSFQTMVHFIASGNGVSGEAVVDVNATISGP